MRRAIFAAVAPVIAACGAFGLAASCGGTAAEAPIDACADVHADAGHDADAPEDATPWWYDVFDAAVYRGFSPPIVGEYPPNGPGVCNYSGCFVNGTCDPETGWCCSGKPRAGTCVCGEDAGCVPPAVCCAVPGELVMRCVATPDECPGTH